MIESVELRRGTYRDSVSLMQASRAVTGTGGVRAALVAMATPLNVELARGQGFAVADDAGPNDLLVAVRGEDDDAVRRGLAALEAALTAPPGDGETGAGGRTDRAPARTTRGAVRRTGAGLAVVSVPGRYAFAEALDALQAGANVLVFSDNVPVEQEVRLKEEGARRGLLVMGPDCGTAAVAGVGLGFANTVRPGPVGLVAASGTGAQQLMCLLDAAGVGVSSCLGVGGRDLSAAVGGRSTLQALDALDADPATELVVVVSKPPAPRVAATVAERTRTMRTPTVLALLGPGRDDLTAVAERAVAAVGGQVPDPWPRWLPDHSGRHPATAGQRADGGGRADGTGGSGGGKDLGRRRGGGLRGLFSGGTLCDEAMVIAGAALGPVASNIPLDPEDPAQTLPANLRPAPGQVHFMIDFGDDPLTEGRPHPMIDPSLRLERCAAELTDPATGVVLLDVVLGHGAHPDPAGALAPVVAGANAPVVVSLCGTAGDPQGLDRQARTLREAGVAVFLSNAAAARHAVALVADAA